MTTRDSKEGGTKSVAGSAGGSLEGPVSHGAYNPTHDEIQARAYEIHTERGGDNGHDLDDWLQAERELKAEHSKEKPARARQFTTNGFRTSTNGREAESISWIDSMPGADTARNGLIILNHALILASGLFRR